MAFWRQFTHGLRTLTHRASADRDISDELGSYFEHAVAAFVERGFSPEEARRAAQREFGNMTAIREQVRSYGWENMVETLFDSLRYAVRRLRHSPGFTAVSLLMLALGIGAVTAIFSVVDGVLLKPLPYSHSEQLVSLRHTAPGIDVKELGMSPSFYFTYSDENRVFQNIAVWSDSTSTVTGLTEPEQVPVLVATHSLLPILRVRPALGRAFSASDDDPKSTPTVMLSDGYWRSRFGGDRSVPGRRMTIDGNQTEIIGILPPSFQFMDRQISLLMPLQFDRAKVFLINFSFEGIARLRDGVTIQQANADLARILPMAPAKFPLNPGFSLEEFQSARITPNLLSLKDYLIGDSGNTLWVLMGTVGIVLLIACANVANLSLVRADGRRRELAIRAALGAGWRRIAGELLLESLLLGIVGGALGLVLAYGALRILIASGFSNLPRLGNVSIDLRALAFALGISLLSGFIFGLIPVFKYARPQLLSVLKSEGRSLSQSKERHRARSILVIAQMALALVLLISSGLMIRTFQALHHVDPGFSGAVQTFDISIPEAQAKEPAGVMRTEKEILGKLGALAGVSSAAIVDTLPMDHDSIHDLIYAEDRVYREGAVPAPRLYKYISPGYISAIGSRLIAGRDLTWAETENQTPVALISENLAREWWHDPRAALGKRIRPTPKDDWREVIGVVADLHDDGIDREAPAVAYWPLLVRKFDGSGHSQPQRSVAFLVRTPRAGTASLLSEIRRAVWSVNPGLPVANVRTLLAIYDQSLARTSFTLVLLAIAGGVALLLGVIGIYGVISYSVSQRTREIGIRIALGAPLREVTGMFVRHGLILSGIGAACGLVVAFALTRLMKALLFNVSPADPLTYVTVSAGLMAMVILASYLPARRATKVDPAETLRAE